MKTLSNETAEFETIIALKNGNQTALEQVYKQHFTSILHFVISNGGNNDDAKDIYQEAIIVFYENLQKPEFKLTCKIKTYLYSISRHLWLKELDKKKRFVQPTDPSNIEDNEVFMLLADDELSPHQLKEAQFKTMNHSLELLGEPCKTLLTDFYIHNLSMQEITQKMGYTNSDNAKNQKYKCLQRLIKIFDKNHKP